MPAFASDQVALACRVTRDLSDQVISDSTTTAISFDTVFQESQTGPIWVASAPTDLLLPETGWWFCSGFATFAANATGRRLMLLNAGGGNITNEWGFAAATVPACGACGVLYLPRGSVVKLLVFQNSGGNLNITATGISLSVAFFGR